MLDETIIQDDHTPSRGIILVASGAPFYGRMAYNLAVSIKAVEDIPITVLHNGAGLSHLSDKQLSIFNEVKQIDTQAFATKLTLIDHSPYDETIYLDADMVWLPGRTPTQLFDSLKGVAFTSITEGYYDYEENKSYANSMYHFWADPMEAKLKYDLKGKFYQWRSEVMFFTKEAKPMFDLAKEVYNNPKVKVKQFAGHTPDELAINIAASVLGIEPHEYKWKPAYWHRLHGEGASLAAIMNSYCLMSVGGNFASKIMKDCYNNVCKAAHRTLGLQYLFLLQSKKAVMPERIKM
jgi:hypothetical protein